MKWFNSCLFFFILSVSAHAQDTSYNRTGGKYVPLDTSNFRLVRMLIEDEDFFVSMDSTNSFPYIRRGMYKRHLGDYQGSIDDLKHGLRYENDSHLMATVHYWIGGAEDRLFHFDAALLHFTKTIDIGSRHPNPVKTINLPELDWKIELAQIYFDRGLINNSLKRYAEAEKDFRTAMRLKSDWSSPYYGLGLVYEYQEDYDKAIEHYKQALIADPTNYGTNKRVHNNLSVIYQKQKKYDLALAEAEMSLEMDPTYDYAWVNLVDAKQLMGDTKGACESAKEFLTISRATETEKVAFLKKYCNQ